MNAGTKIIGNAQKNHFGLDFQTLITNPIDKIKTNLSKTEPFGLCQPSAETKRENSSPGKSKWDRLGLLT